MKKKITSIFLAFLMLFMVGCNDKNNGGDGEMIRENISGISYAYPSGFEVTENDGVKYIYFVDESFFMVETSAETYTSESFTDEIVNTFFNSTEQSYNSGGWSNAERISEIESVKIDDKIDAWKCSFSMNYKTGSPYKSDVFVTYYQGKIISFVLISIENAYADTKPMFDLVLSSLKIVD